MEGPMPKPNDLSRSPAALSEDSTLIAVIEMGLASWLIAGRIPGVNRNPLRKQDPDPEALLVRLHRWRDEAVQAGHSISRIVVAFEAGRDGFWLARWLQARGIERRRRYVATTDSDHDSPIFPNLARDLVVDGPNQQWVADITYIAITSGFVYLAAILDAWSRRVVGYAISRSIDAGPPAPP